MQKKKIPYNQEAEQSVLGDIFLSKLALQKAVEALDKEAFYIDANIKIFDIIKSLSQKQIPVDMTTVTSELKKRDWLNQIGGVEYLSQILNSVPTAANIEEYINNHVIDDIT